MRRGIGGARCNAVLFVSSLVARCRCPPRRIRSLGKYQFVAHIVSRSNDMWSSRIFLFVLAAGCLPVTAHAYIVCQCAPDYRPYVECSGRCPTGCNFVAASPGDYPSCSSSQIDPSKPDCGQHWSDYKGIGEKRGNPCPLGCERGPAVEYRASFQRFPPQPVFGEKFQCYGTPKTLFKCADAWTDWYTTGGAVGNPCPKKSSCPIRGRELGKGHRVINFVHPQDKTKFECWKEVSTG